MTARVLTARLQREAEYEAQSRPAVHTGAQTLLSSLLLCAAISESMKGDFLSAFAPVLHLIQANSQFGNILAELLMSHWAEDDASV